MTIIELCFEITLRKVVKNGLTILNVVPKSHTFQSRALIFLTWNQSETNRTGKKGDLNVTNIDEFGQKNVVTLLADFENLERSKKSESTFNNYGTPNMKNTVLEAASSPASAAGSSSE